MMRKSNLQPTSKTNTKEMTPPKHQQQQHDTKRKRRIEKKRKEKRTTSTETSAAIQPARPMLCALPHAPPP